MEKDFEKKYHDVEKEHWWFKSRRHYLIDLLKDAPKNSKVLDIGCSSGIFLNDLEQLGFNKENLYGIDISDNAIQNCKSNGIKNAFVMDAQKITLNEQFDIIVASDCLEHLEDDRKALRNWKSLLKPEGKMYVFVPAFQSLWSNHDVVNMHFRRYTNNELKAKMADEKLLVVKSGYWNFSLFPAVYIFRKVSNLLKKDSSQGDIQAGNQTLNAAMLQLVLIENKLLRFVRFPFGVSTFCIVTKST